MSDVRIRALEREAVHSPIARASLLTERVRAGTLSQERLELAAYAGDVDARAATGTLCPGGPDGGHTGFCDERCGVHSDLAGWVQGLSRWGPEAIDRAAAAASRVALPWWWENLKRVTGWRDLETGHPAYTVTERAIGAADAWFGCPCDRHEDAWLAAAHTVHMDTVPGSHNYAWVVTGPWSHDPSRAHNREVPQHARHFAGEPAAREAISSALIAWALRGSSS